MDLQKYEEALNDISETIVSTHFNNDKYKYVEAKLLMMDKFENKIIYEELFTSKPFFFPYFRKNFVFLCKNAPNFVGSVLSVNANEERLGLKGNLAIIKSVYFKTNSKVIIATAENLYRDTRKKLYNILDSPTILKNKINEVIRIIEPISTVRYYWTVRPIYYQLFRELRFSLQILYNIGSLNKISGLEKDVLYFYISLLSNLNDLKSKDYSKYIFFNLIIEDLELIYKKIEELHPKPQYKDRVSDSGSVTTKPIKVNKAVGMLGHIEGLTWDKITIVLTSLDTIRLKAGDDYNKEHHYSALDMNDKRRNRKADNNWALLSLFAVKNGLVTHSEIDNMESFSEPKNAIYSLQKKLKQVIGLQDNPIENHEIRVGYKAKLNFRSEVPFQFHGSDQQIEKINELKGE